MTLLTRSGSLIQGPFGLRQRYVPERGAPAVTVTQRFEEDQTFLDVEITGAVSGATYYTATFVDAATGAILGTVHLTTTGSVLVPNVDATTKLLYQVVAHPNGLALQAGYDQTAVVALAEDDAPVLFAEKVGDAFIITPPVWTVQPIAESFVIEEDADGVGAGTPLDPTPTHVPDELHYRVVFTATGPLGDEATSTSAYIGPMDPAPGGDLFQLTADHVEITGARYHPTGQTTYFKPEIALTDIPVGHVVEWTGRSPIAFPGEVDEADWRPLEEIETDVWVPAFDTLDTDATTRPPNYSLWRANPDSPDRSWLRFRHGPSDTPEDRSPISGLGWFIPEPAGTPPTADAAYRQFLARSDAMLGVTPDNPDQYEAGIFGGDCMQWLQSPAWSANGAKFACGQDVGQFLFSETAGRTWYRPRHIGLKAMGIMGVKADPANASRWIFKAHVGFQANKIATVPGIYVTEDDFDTCTLVKLLANDGDCRWANDLIDCFPATGGATSKWYAAFNSGQGVAGGFVKSGSNNGASWGTPTSLAWGTYGRIYQLTASPHTASRLFMGTHTGGLRRSSDDGATWPAFPGDLPSGPVHWFWIDPDDASHMLCTLTSGAATRGLYETNNATAGTPSWTRIRDCPAHNAAVGALSGGARTIYVKCGNLGSSLANDTDHIRLRSGTWITRNTAAPNRINLNFGGGQPDIQPYQGMCNAYTSLDGGDGQEQTWVRAHPTDPDIFLTQCRTALLKTVDQGLNIDISSAGFGGLNWRGVHYDLSNKNNIVGTYHDLGAGITTNAGQSLRVIKFAGFKDRAMAVHGSNISSYTGRAVTRLPNNSSVAEADWRGRIIGSAAASSSYNGCQFYIDNGDTVMQDWLGATPTANQSNATGGGLGIRWKIGFLRHNPNKVWSGPNIVNLASSTTWGLSPSSRSVIGAAQDGTDVTYAFSGQTIYRASTWGGAWSTFYTFTGADILDLGAPVGGCSEYDGRRMFFKHGPRAFKMLVDDGDGMATATHFSLEGSIAGTTIFDTPYAVDAIIGDISGDPLDERYVYITTETMGVAKRVFRLRFNAAFTNFSECTNITENGPHGAHGAFVHPCGVFGGVQVAHNGMGSYCWPAPDDWQPRVGAFKFSGQPSNGQNITINGQTWTFVTSGATGPQTNIGASLSATLTQLATDLNASADTDITPCTYTARYGNLLEVTMDSPTQGVDEPFPLTAGTTTNATVINAVTPCKDGMWLDLPLPIYEL